MMMQYNFRNERIFSATIHSNDANDTVIPVCWWLDFLNLFSGREQSILH